jgi:hypothetical protein
VATGTFGGASTAVPINQGWNLLGVPASGIANTTTLANDMTRSGQLPAGSVQAVATDHGGIWNVTIPGYTYATPLTRNDGVFVLSSSRGKTWTPSGTPYTSTSTINFGSGWNLVSAGWPNPGLNTDAIFNQIEAENNACQADAFTNGACNPTVSELDTYGPTYDSSGNVNGAQLFTWTPAAPDSAGNATWPEPYGNQVPFTNGMWVHAGHSLSWTPQGTECQTISNGMCR